ncbi:DUF2199 domain-containing protein [Litorisediminicola beolgyonensis]|uniref:DUF2199 domain-containing protein n=1 Tax=Litorisediminicola beolgyonensis TaxID=1173614 RepID=A0ABW3ZE97_9RHOB
MSLLDLDARWRRLHDESRSCPCCGRQFSGLIDLGYDHPDDWPHGHRDDRPDVQVGGDRLTADLCRLDGRYFIRCTLPIPIRGSDERFSFGPWAETSEALFRAYLGTYDDPPGTFEGGPALLANDLPGFGEIGAALRLEPRDAATRPELFAEDGPLRDAQTQGLSFDALLDLYAEAGHDIRPHLQQD